MNFYKINNFIVNMQQNCCSQSIQIASLAAKFIVQEMIQQIKNKQLIQHTPQFLNHQINSLLQQYMIMSAPNYGSLYPTGLQQQSVQKIRKIAKDNLSPKQLPSQHPIHLQLPDMISQLGSKKMSLTGRNSLLRKQSIISNIPSHSQKKQAINKSLNKKKDNYQNFVLAVHNQQQDSQIVRLRQKVEFKYQEQLKQKKMQSQKQKQKIQKLESFSSQFKQKQYTFDYGGETINFQNKQDRLIYYAMKYGTKTLGRKFQSAFKTLDNSKIQTNLSKRKKADLTNLEQKTQNFKLTAQIPMFNPGDRRSFLQQSDPNKMKLKDYKKIFGKRFSHHDKNSITIQTSIQTNNQNQQDLFGSRKHFRDSNSLQQSQSSSINRDPPYRKLALPRLQGKYKVLDRYQES